MFSTHSHIFLILQEVYLRVTKAKEFEGNKSNQMKLCTSKKYMTESVIAVNFPVFLKFPNSLLTIKG